MLNNKCDKLFVGLITYRETTVLVDPEHTSLIRKQMIALTVGHEIAHQWFGNLGMSRRSIYHSSAHAPLTKHKFYTQLQWNGGPIYG